MILFRFIYYKGEKMKKLIPISAILFAAFTMSSCTNEIKQDIKSSQQKIKKISNRNADLHNNFRILQRNQDLLSQQFKANNTNHLAVINKLKTENITLKKKNKDAFNRLEQYKKDIKNEISDIRAIAGLLRSTRNSTGKALKNINLLSTTIKDTSITDDVKQTNYNAISIDSCNTLNSLNIGYRCNE
jgi:predicted small secreted protein